MMKEGEILKAAIRKTGLLVDDAAKALGKSPRSLQNYFDKETLSQKVKDLVLEKLGINLSNQDMPIIVKNVNAMILQNQIRLIAGQNTLLTAIAELHAKQTGQLATQLLNVYRSLQKENEQIVSDEMKKENL
jgi:hypothetical protein